LIARIVSTVAYVPPENQPAFEMTLKVTVSADIEGVPAAKKRNPNADTRIHFM
jgi:hypothetical protein